MKCHYEVLGVPRDVGNDDLKKAYRKLALKYHPDKNPSDLEHAKEQFLLVQQAYEILSDPHERSWYDSHREAILKGGLGGDYKDDSLDVMKYFTPSCFKGYDDNDQGFYSVYREVFNKLAAEDSEYMTEDDSDFEVPSFGDSQSPYESVVHSFYAYWQSYSTKKSYSWLDPFDIREAENRRVLRLIEKENKKIRDKARKQRNEEVRNLVAFVRKRDKRVQAQAKLMQERAANNVKKGEEARLRQRRERQEALRNYQESEWLKFSNVEKELEVIEASLAAEFGESDVSLGSEDESESDSFANDLFCVACNKVFKTEKAFANHENSKKHRENVELLKSTLESEDDSLMKNERDESMSNETGISEPSSYVKDELNKANNGEGLDSTFKNSSGANTCDTDDGTDTSIDSEEIEVKKSKKKHKKSNVAKLAEEELSDEDFDLSATGPRKQRRRKQSTSVTQAVSADDPVECDKVNVHEAVADAAPCVDASAVETSVPKKTKAKKSKETKSKLGGVENSEDGRCAEEKGGGARVKGKKLKEVPKKGKSKVDVVADPDHCCVTCRSEFPSKNKLFDHLKKTGHSVYVPGAAASVEGTRKGKDRRTK